MHSSHLTILTYTLLMFSIAYASSLFLISKPKVEPDISRVAPGNRSSLSCERPAQCPLAAAGHHQVSDLLFLFQSVLVRVCVAEWWSECVVCVLKDMCCFLCTVCAKVFHNRNRIDLYFLTTLVFFFQWHSGDWRKWKSL